MCFDVVFRILRRNVSIGKEKECLYFCIQLWMNYPDSIIRRLLVATPGGGAVSILNQKTII
jgi:hypothetical protein